MSGSDAIAFHELEVRVAMLESKLETLMVEHMHLQSMVDDIFDEATQPKVEKPAKGSRAA